MTWPPMSSSLRKALTGMLAMALSLLLSTSPQAAESVIRIGDFARLTSDSPLPVEWQPLTFKKIKQHTQYRLVNDSGQTVVRANSRNADYKKAFGREPTRISGVAIMTDSDNTGESARAWYGDIVFSRE